MYQQCGPVCPQTCDTVNDASCSGGCTEGCFCPDGQVFANGNCIDATDCQGTLTLHACIGTTKHITAVKGNIACNRLVYRN